MEYGLTKLELESIINVFRSEPNVEKAVLFGSRAKGNFKPGSDVDIAIYGRHFLFNNLLSLLVKCDELELLQKIDLVKFETIDNTELMEHIGRVGIIVYEKMKANV